MKRDTLKALIGSIKKWHGIAYHEWEDYGSENCPLCDLFWYQGCYGCPVKEITKQKFCWGSPYYLYCEAYGKGAKAERKAAVNELKFLVTLLPEGKEAEMEDGTIWYWEWSK
jgi:hypothetical protein